MSEREQQRVSKSKEDADEIVETTAQKNEALDESVDSILDEIDNVLEQNAEDFVKSFVQKGGQ